MPCLSSLFACTSRLPLTGSTIGCHRNTDCRRHCPPGNLTCWSLGHRSGGSLLCARSGAQHRSCWAAGQLRQHQSFAHMPLVHADVKQSPQGCRRKQPEAIRRRAAPPRAAQHAALCLLPALPHIAGATHFVAKLVRHPEDVLCPAVLGRCENGILQACAGSAAVTARLDWGSCNCDWQG